LLIPSFPQPADTLRLQTAFISEDFWPERSIPDGEERRRSKVKQGSRKNGS
jgi:hypothetical protein